MNSSTELFYYLADVSVRVVCIHFGKLKMSPAGDSLELVRIICRRLYLNEVEDRGPVPHQHGGAVMALHRRGRQGIKPIQGKMPIKQMMNNLSWLPLFIYRVWITQS
jgi:hypothetical protein